MIKSSTRSEIERIIGNRHTEAHPFKRGNAGMEWFSRMIPLVDELCAEELKTFLLPMVEGLLAKVDNCFTCRAKGLVFAERFSSIESPGESKKVPGEIPTTYFARTKGFRAA